jgi:hypothetical protein
MRQPRNADADSRVWEGADVNGASRLPAAAPLGNAATSERSNVREQPRPSPYRIFNFDVGPTRLGAAAARAEAPAAR